MIKHSDRHRFSDGRHAASRSVVSAVALAAAVGLLGACSSSTKSDASPTSVGRSTSNASYDATGVLRFGLDLSEGELPFDPTRATNADIGDMLGQLLDDSLLRRQPDGSLAPALATAAVIINPQTISVTLRPGVTFQDGTPLDAAAVKFTLLRNSAEENVVFSAPIHDIASVDLTGDLSLTIHLSKPDAGAFYPSLADLTTMPVSPTAVRRNNPNPVANPLGAGPFRVKEYVPGQSLMLVKNADYWDAKDIRLGGIDFVNEPSSGPAAIDALKAGTVDAITSDVSELGGLTGDNIQTSIASSLTAKEYFPLCATSGPLRDLRVRQALSFALDRNAINQAIAQGRGEPAWALVPSANSLYSTDLTGYYAYNPTKAKQLLTAAGYAKGLNLTMVPGLSGDLQRLALIVQQEWKAIGVNLTLRTLSPATYVQDVFINHVANLTDANVVTSGVDAISFIFTPGHLGDMCSYNSPQLDSMVAQMGGLAPTDPRYVQLWKQAQDFIVRNALQVWAIWLPTVIAYNGARVGDVETVFPGVTAYPDFFTAYIKK